MSPAKCCILCVLHSSTKRTSPCLKSCIQILDLYCRQFLQTQHNKKTVFCFWKRNKKFKNSYEIFKKLMPPPNKDFELPFSILFLCFLPVVFFVFFRIHRRWSSPRKWHTPWRSLRRWRFWLYLDGNGEEVGWLEFPRCWDLFDSKSNLSNLYI